MSTTMIATKTPKARHDFTLPIASEAHLKRFVELAWGVRIPDKRVCAGHVSPWRAFCDAYFARAPVTVWKASRGFGGKSFLLALLGLTEAVTLKADVNVLGGSGEQSSRVLEHAQSFWDYEAAPRYLLEGDVKRETRLVWGNKVYALMASQASVRGPHPQRLRLDEIDEMKLDILDAAMGQPMSRHGVPAQTVMSSTHQYADGTMTEILRRAADRSWPVAEWCYKETSADGGWLTRAEIELKRKMVTGAMWRVEFDLQEPSPESRAIQPDAVREMFRRDAGEYRGAPREYVEIEGPVQNGRYAHGADWAKKQDWTVIVTLRTDTDPMRVVAFERLGRMPWPAMTTRLDERVKRYGGQAAHDGTGLGDVVNDNLTVPAESVLMVGRTRSDLLSEYIAAVERNEIVSPHIAFMEAEHRLASVDDVYRSGTTFHLPDSIAAMALAYRAGRNTVEVVHVGKWLAERRNRR